MPTDVTQEEKATTAKMAEEFRQRHIWLANPPDGTTPEEIAAFKKKFNLPPTIMNVSPHRGA